MIIQTPVDANDPELVGLVHASDPILIVSVDQFHSDVRREILERAGFKVVAVTNLRSLMEACKTKAFSLAIIGDSIPPEEKARIAREMQDCYKVPSLELPEGGDPDIVSVAFAFLQSSKSDPLAFLAMAKSVQAGFYDRRKHTQNEI